MVNCYYPQMDIGSLLRSSISNRRILLSALLYVGVAVFLMTWNPPEYKGCRGHRPDLPEFNGYLLDFENPSCHDVPMVDVILPDGSGRNGRFSHSAKEHEDGITVGFDKLIRVKVWFHNSGSEEKRTNTTARNVRIGSMFDKKPASVHAISAMISSDNAETVHSSDHGGEAVVKTGTPSVLEYVPDTTQICLQAQDMLERGLAVTESCGDYPEGKTRYRAKISDGIANGSVKVNDVKAGDNYTGYVMFLLRVLPQGGAR
jgi:hypothetical protein